MIPNILIVHYNTPKLTECLIKSINKYTPNCNIYIFDNSNKKPFTYRQDNITYYDNTKGQIINFEEWLKTYPNRLISRGNHFGSAKHCYTIQKCMELIDDNFILLDSDVLLKRDISELYDDKYAYIGEIQYKNGAKPRVRPFCCFINTKLCKEREINYFNGERMMGLGPSPINDYDTGANFYFECGECEHKEIDWNIYI